MKRGKFEFEVTAAGQLVDGAANVEMLRRLWLDRTLITDDDIGPGDPGDFDYGAWHVACHLAGAGGVCRTADSRLLWLEISHRPMHDEYYASVSAQNGATALPLNSAEAAALLRGSTLLGFIEGNSTGHTSARGVNDPDNMFNLWRRQDFDQPPTSDQDGGKVWEHWCTLRDIRPTAHIGTSVLAAYVALVAALGDRFAPTVARGRRDYGHPVQLAALVHAGFAAEPSATWDTQPLEIPKPVEALLLEATPAAALAAAGRLDWSQTPCYYMFDRRIGRWSPAMAVRDDLQKFARQHRS